MRIGINVLSTIQLVKDVSYGSNIDLVERNATKTFSKILEAWQTYMKPVEPSVGLPPIRDVSCASDFRGALLKVLKQVSRGACRPNLAGILKVNLVFNVGMPKPCCADQADPNRGNEAVMVDLSTFEVKKLPRAARIAKRKDEPLAMFLRSGDVVIMAGEARECFHELWDLFQGLEVAWSKGVGELEVELDSPCSVNFVLKGEGDKHPPYALVKVIQELIGRDLNYMLRYIPQQKNNDADWLAKFSFVTSRHFGNSFSKISFLVCVESLLSHSFLDMHLHSRSGFCCFVLQIL
ncbi:hypothetical protein PVK06_004629 [Gossypium arboreum]|uniref:RNase H type-1 domain-containing protein n=1 Tax=Gossypium arboreum TaxID=29729 RepID=A0ABR0QSI7_GOSAR|nr:hypothetical protein PVK06_004629 [Gossypium arboreum]